MAHAANDTGREQGATLVALEVENVKRLKVVRIRPDGAPLVVVGGDNEQGKSTLLDSIEMLLGGGRHVPAEPLRHGETDGRIFGEFSNGLVAERKFWPGGTSLTLRQGRRGKPLSGPQGVLDELYNELAFEPLDFLDERPPEQTAIMMRALGLDFSDLEQEHAETFEERRVVNAKIKSLKGAIEEAVRYPNAPKAEVSIAELAEELKQAHETNNAHTAHQSDLAKLRSEAADADAKQLRLWQEFQEAVKAMDAAKAALAAAEAVTMPEPVDVEPLQQQLQDAETTNREVRANQQVAAHEYELVDLEEKTDELTEKLQRIERDKAKRLAAARFPVEGLGFGPGGPTLDGVPLEQAAMSRKLRVVAALAFRLKPKLKILLLRRGSELNTKNLQLLAELAEAEGGQVWVERVSEDGKGCDVVLEDGELRRPEAAE